MSVLYAELVWLAVKVTRSQKVKPRLILILNSALSVVLVSVIAPRMRSSSWMKTSLKSGFPRRARNIHHEEGGLVSGMWNGFLTGGDLIVHMGHKDEPQYRAMKDQLLRKQR